MKNLALVLLATLGVVSPAHAETAATKTIIMQCHSVNAENNQQLKVNIYLQKDGLIATVTKKTFAAPQNLGVWSVAEIVRGGAKAFISRQPNNLFSLLLPAVMTNSPFRQGTLVFDEKQNRINVLCKYAK